MHTFSFLFLAVYTAFAWFAQSSSKSTLDVMPKTAAIDSSVGSGKACLVAYTGQENWYLCNPITYNRLQSTQFYLSSVRMNSNHHFYDVLVYQITKK